MSGLFGRIADAVEKKIESAGNELGEKAFKAKEYVEHKIDDVVHGAAEKAKDVEKKVDAADKKIDDVVHGRTPEPPPAPKPAEPPPIPHTEVKPEEFGVTTHAMMDAQKSLPKYQAMKKLADFDRIQAAEAVLSADPDERAKLEARAKRSEARAEGYYDKHLKGVADGLLSGKPHEPGVDINEATKLAKEIAVNHDSPHVKNTGVGYATYSYDPKTNRTEQKELQPGEIEALRAQDNRDQGREKAAHAVASSPRHAPGHAKPGESAWGQTH